MQICFENMEGSDNYCRTTAELQGGMEIEKEKNPGCTQITFKYKNIQ